MFKCCGSNQNLGCRHFPPDWPKFFHISNMLKITVTICQSYMKTSLYFVEMEASLVKLYNRKYFSRNKVTSWTTPRPNNLSLVCLYLSLYISFLLFGYFIFLFFDTQRQKALLYKSSRKD